MTISPGEGEKGMNIRPIDSPICNAKNESVKKDAENLLRSVNEAASLVRNLHMTFILLTVYVGITIASTTDEQLLRISPVTLPILNVQLPIKGLYIMVPWLIVVLHFELLGQFYLLAHKIRSLEDAAQILPQDERLAIYAQLANFPFVHMLAGRQHGALLQWIMSLSVWITVIAVPLFLLLWVQIGFLPFHDSNITWTQRGAVIVEVVVLLIFWPRLVSRSGLLAWWWCGFARLSYRFVRLVSRAWALLSRRPNRFPQQPTISGTNVPSGSGAVVLTSTALFVVVCSLTVATVPEEAFEVWLLSHLPGSVKLSYETTYREFSGREFFLPTFFLFEARGWPADANWDRAPHISFFHRNLDLRRKVLTSTDLEPRLVSALHEGTNTEQEEALKAVVGLDLKNRDLRYANLEDAILSKATLKGAKLDRASLIRAHLEDSDLDDAELKLAALDGANLRGIRTTQSTHFQGASLAGAHLEGANLAGTQLQAVNLRAAQLQGANLHFARLEGAELWEAQLMGANLSWAQVYGADFGRAKANLVNVLQLRDGPLTENRYDNARKDVEKAVPPGGTRIVILAKLKIKNSPMDHTYFQAEGDYFCTRGVNLPHCIYPADSSNHTGRLAQELSMLACSSRAIARSMAARAIASSGIDLDADLSTALLAADCKPVRSLTDETILKLQENAEATRKRRAS